MYSQLPITDWIKLLLFKRILNEQNENETKSSKFRCINRTTFPILVFVPIAKTGGERESGGNLYRRFLGRSDESTRVAISAEYLLVRHRNLFPGRSKSHIWATGYEGPDGRPNGEANLPPRMPR